MNLSVVHLGAEICGDGSNDKDTKGRVPTGTWLAGELKQSLNKRKVDKTVLKAVLLFKNVGDIQNK